MGAARLRPHGGAGAAVWCAGRWAVTGSPPGEPRRLGTLRLVRCGALPVEGAEVVVSQPVGDRMTPVELAAVLRRLPDGVAVLDADWTIGYANSAAARLLGRRAGELAGRDRWLAAPAAG